jgi:hypothetical protein
MCSAGRVVTYREAPLLLLQLIASHFPIATSLSVFLGMACLILTAFLAVQAWNVSTGLTSGERHRISELRRVVQLERVRPILLHHDHQPIPQRLRASLQLTSSTHISSEHCIRVSTG